MSDMKHMEFLEAVVAEDVAVLREKETTYQGSWKAAGGRSAWFMARRNLDRLLNMMRPPVLIQEVLQDLTDHIHATTDGGDGETQIEGEMLRKFRSVIVAEDIFLKIQEDPSGDDGTVLAVIRDARRYFTLVEAEMMARDVVVAEFSPEKTEHRSTLARGAEIEEDFYRLKAQEWAMEPLTAEALINEALSTIRDKKYFGPLGAAYSPTTDVPEQMPAPLTDGNKHVNLYPWRVDTRWLFKHGANPEGKREKEFEDWYRQIVPGVWVLDVHVESRNASRSVPSELVGLYQRVNGGWLIDINRVPPSLREHYPVMQHEANAKELSDKADWIRDMYEWINDEDKFRVRMQWTGWTIGNED